ncbi:MAG: AAA family ATPase [Bacteroidales bacterium]
MQELIKIAVTGPESTGKSMMAQQLANYFQTVWVPEYARVYLLRIGRDYNYDDILEIARGQKASAKVFESIANRLLFSDTELLVTKIWCDVKYGRCHPWIEEELNKQDFRLYLLMDIDLPWEFDPLREHPEKRRYLMDLYIKELEQRKLNYRIIGGTGEERFRNALQALNELPAVRNLK